jgi:hypothetical protein
MNGKLHASQSKQKENEQMTETDKTAPIVDAPAPKALVGLPRKAVKVTGRKIDLDLIEAPTALNDLAGSTRQDFSMSLLNSVLMAIGGSKKEDTALHSQVIAASAALAAFKPLDEIEGMLAAQAVTLHYGAMEALRRSIHPDQPADIAARLRKDGANLARAMTDMIEALDRKRGKGPQVVRVERVVVHDGGQAIVGNVAPGGRG